MCAWPSDSRGGGCGWPRREGWRPHTPSSFLPAAAEIVLGTSTWYRETEEGACAGALALPAGDVALPEAAVTAELVQPELTWLANGSTMFCGGGRGEGRGSMDRGAAERGSKRAGRHASRTTHWPNPPDRVSQTPPTVMVSSELVTCTPVPALV